MEYIGQIEHHRPSTGGDICLYDQEPWPCSAVQIKQQVIAKVAALVEEKASAYIGYAPEADTLRELAEEIKEL